MPSVPQTTWTLHRTPDARFESCVATVLGKEVPRGAEGSFFAYQPWTPNRVALPAPAHPPSRYGIVPRAVLADPDLTASDKLVCAYLRSLHYVETERELQRNIMRQRGERRIEARAEVDNGGRSAALAYHAQQPFELECARRIAERIGIAQRTVVRSLKRIETKGLAYLAKQAGREPMVTLGRQLFSGAVVAIPWALSIEQPELHVDELLGYVAPRPMPNATRLSPGYLTRFALGLGACSQLTPLARIAYAESRAWATAATAAKAKAGKPSDLPPLALDFRRMERWAKALGCSRSSIALAARELEQVGLILVKRKHRTTSTRYAMPWGPRVGYADAELEAFHALRPKPKEARPLVARRSRALRLGEKPDHEPDPGEPGRNLRQNAAPPTPKRDTDLRQIASPMGSLTSASQEEDEKKNLSVSAHAHAGTRTREPVPLRERLRAAARAALTDAQAQADPAMLRARSLVGHDYWTAEGEAFWNRCSVAERIRWLAEAPHEPDASERRRMLQECCYQSEWLAAARR